MAWNTKQEVLIEIKEDKKQEVFDIEMPNHHNFFANNIIAHNCHMVNWADCMENSTSDYGKIIKHFQTINPNVVIIGVTGTPFRGTESIIGPWWKKKLDPVIGMEFLLQNEYIMPTKFGFGHDDVKYDLDEFKAKSEEGTEDFTRSQLEAMREKMDESTTAKIMREVIEITKDRNAVMITCASVKHCEEAAKELPEGSYVIISTNLGTKQRREALKRVSNGEVKFLLQIGCLTTGYSEPLIDTSVILRRIGSLTLLIQLLGRGMRLLKDHHIEKGIKKDHHLCLDYSGTMESMQEMFDNPMLEDAVYEKSKDEKDVIECPKCGTGNSSSARRCRGVNDIGDRCDFFWQSKECPHCGVENDTTARDCRSCLKTLIDPNKALTNKHYTDSDYKRVLNLNVFPAKNGGLCVFIDLASQNIDGTQETAKLFFNPWSSSGAKKIFKYNFIDKFVDKANRRKLLALPDAQAFMSHIDFIKEPEFITHRINSKGKSIVNGVKFYETNKETG